MAESGQEMGDTPAFNFGEDAFGETGRGPLDEGSNGTFQLGETHGVLGNGSDPPGVQNDPYMETMDEEVFSGKRPQTEIFGVPVDAGQIFNSDDAQSSQSSHFSHF